MFWTRGRSQSTGNAEAMLVKEANISMPRIVDAVESVEIARTMSSADDLFCLMATEDTHYDMLLEEY